MRRYPHLRFSITALAVAGLLAAVGLVMSSNASFATTYVRDHS